MWLSVVITGTAIWVAGFAMREHLEEHSRRSQFKEVWDTLWEHWIVGTPLYTILLSLSAAGLLPTR